MKIASLNKEKLVVVIFLFSNIIDHGGGLKIKYLSIALLIMCLIVHIICNDRVRLSSTEIGIFIVLPLFQLCYAILFCNIPARSAFSSITFNIGILFYLFVLNYNIDYEFILKVFLKIMYALSLCIIFTAFLFEVLLLTGNVSIINNIYFMAQVKRLGIFGIYNLHGFNLPVVYPSCSMFLIFAIGLACYYKKYLYIMIMFLACILTTASANILFSGLVIVSFVLFTDVKKKTKIGFAVLGLIMVIILIAFMGEKFSVLLKEVIDDITFQSSGDKIKMGHISSATGYLFEKLKYFFFGMGGGSEFYSTGIGKTTSVIEVSHISYWRQFGTLSSILFFGYIINLIWKMVKNKKRRIIGIGLLMLFISTGTNPQLMSPMFIIVLGICKYYIDSTRVYHQKLFIETDIKY